MFGTTLLNEIKCILLQVISNDVKTDAHKLSSPTSVFVTVKVNDVPSATETSTVPGPVAYNVRISPLMLPGSVAVIVATSFSNTLIEYVKIFFFQNMGLKIRLYRYVLLF